MHTLAVRFRRIHASIVLAVTAGRVGLKRVAPAAKSLTPTPLWAVLILGGCLLWQPLPARGEFPEVVNTQDPQDTPPTAKQAAARITVPTGFRVTLFAGDPAVRQPIAMSLDDRGRLWVAECYTYQGRDYDATLRDRIVILADVDHDGQFDQRSVFWDQGQQLTGLEFGFGGVWVLNDGRLQWIGDRDGNDVPDGPPVDMLDGFNKTQSSHNIVNGLMWGPDGWLYGRHGILATSEVGAPGTPAYQRARLNCAIWRFHPTHCVFEVVTHGTTNPWGMDYDDYGEMFFTNNVIGHLWHVVPGAHYERMYGEDLNPHRYGLIGQCADHYHWDTGQNWTDSREAKGKHGQLGGGHSHCGGMIYLGDNWPARYRNAMFMCNTHGRRVNQDTLHRHRSGYVARHAPDFLMANNPWFRGVDLKYGPDGGVYVSDWTDLGECHDHDGVHRTSGRIYKVTYGTPRRLPDSDELDIGRRSTDQLVRLQLHRNDWFVRKARRVLQQRAAAGDDLSGAHTQLLQMFTTHADITRKLRALWALYTTRGIDDAWLLKQLDHDNEHIRAWAIRLLVDQVPQPAVVVADFVRLARHDPSGLVRLHLASAMQRLPHSARWQIAAALAEHEADADDLRLALMIWYGIEPAVVAAPSRGIQLARQTRIALLRRHIARRLTVQLNEWPEPVEQLTQLLAEDIPAPARLDLLQGMTEALRGWREAKAPAAWWKIQDTLLQSDDDALRSKARELAVVFGDGRTLDQLRQIAADVQRLPAERRKALQVVIDNRPGDLAPLLHKLVSDRATSHLAIRGLAAYQHPQTPRIVLGQLGRLDSDGRQEVINTLVSRPDYALSLLDAVDSGQLARDEISAYHARQMRSFDDPVINDRLMRLWGIVRQTPAEKKSLIERYRARLTADYLERADLPHGRLVFHKTCATCHTLYGEGGKIGPDITGANRDNLDYILENVIDPSAAVPSQYKLSHVALANGGLISGTIPTQNDRTVTVQTQKEQVVIDRNDIDEIRPSPLSLMPDGLLQTLDDNAIRDLVAYLASPAQVPLPRSERSD